jgi:hypothetical protein
MKDMFYFNMLATILMLLWTMRVPENEKLSAGVCGTFLILASIYLEPLFDSTLRETAPYSFSKLVVIGLLFVFVWCIGDIVKDIRHPPEKAHQDDENKDKSSPL